MGYTEGTSPKGGPSFTTSPQTTADFNRLRDYIEERGNSMTDTSGVRTAMTVKPEGLTFYETDTKRTYQVQAGAWVLIVDDTGWITPTTELATGWTPFTDTVWGGFRYRRRNGVVNAIGAVAKGAYSGLDTMLTLPAGFRPVVPTLSGASNSGLYAVARPDGAVIVSVAGAGRVPISLTFFV